MAKKYKSKLGEFVDAERVTKEHPILTSTGIVIAAEGSWVVRNTEGSIYIVQDNTFNKLFDEAVYGDFYLKSPIEPILPPEPVEPIVPVTPSVPPKSEPKAPVASKSEPKSEPKPEPKPKPKPKQEPKTPPVVTSYSAQPKK